MSATAVLLLNGKIATNAPPPPASEYRTHPAFDSAIFIDQGKVVETGNTEELLQKYRNQLKPSQILDVGGRVIIPGLIDSHLHVIREGNNFNMELRWDGLKSLKTGLEMIRQQVKRTPAGQWIRVVGGWTENQFIEKRLPTLAELDEAGGNCPVFVLHLYDCALVNKLGLQRLGYNASTPNPPSGEIQRDENGNPTGILIAKPNANLLYSTLAMLPKLSPEEQENSTLAYIRELNRFGLTSAIDPGGGFQNYPNDYGIIQKLDAQKKLNLKIAYSLFPQKPKHELEDFKRWSTMVKPGDGSPYLRHLGAGEMLAFTAADFEDFKQARPDLPHEMESDLEPIVRFLVSVRWPFRLHATYGESIERELAIFEKIAAENPTAFTSLRWFIDHAETISDRDIARIKALGGGIAIQHRMAFQGEYFIERYGAKAAAIAPPLRSLFDSGIPVGAGTDGTRVATYNPFVSLYWLVSGKTVGGTQIYNKSSIPSRQQALRLWTEANTWFSYEENVKGRLMPGYAADLVVLNQDYFECPEERIATIESVLTMVDGRIVYESDEWNAGSFTTNAAAPSITAAKEKENLHLIPSWSPVRLFGGYQLEGSTAWPRTAENEIAGQQQQQKAATASVASGGGPHAKPSVNPADFFMYGHDC